MEENRTLLGISEQLEEIKNLVQLLARDAIKKDLEEIITTDERKKFWALCDGFNTTGDIATKSGVTIRSVQRVLKDLQDANLIDVEKRGTPKRVYDYVPKSWRMKNVE